MVSIGDGFKEVWLTTLVVAGLVKINKKKPGKQFDLLFLKALSTGLCTIQTIKANEAIEEGILALIKGETHYLQNSIFFSDIYI